MTRNITVSAFFEDTRVPNFEAKAILIFSEFAKLEENLDKFALFQIVQKDPRYFKFGLEC